MILLSVVYRIAVMPMEINFLVHVSARKAFFCSVKIFHSLSQIVLSNNEALKMARLAFDHAQVLEWVLGNNCIYYLVFFLNFWTIVTIQRYACSLKLWNEVPSNKFQLL